MGYIFQQANLVPVLTAYENVDPAAPPAPRARRSATRALPSRCRPWGSPIGRRTCPASLGARSSAWPSRALVADLPLLVADEPTGLLDSESVEGIPTLSSRLHVEQGKTVAMVTHDPNAARFGTRVLRLDSQLAEDAPGGRA